MSSTSRRQLVALAAITVAVAAVAPIIAWQALHNYALFDDEGYYLLALGALSHHQALYTQVYGTYGPAYYLIFLGTFWLFHLPFTPDAARVISIGLLSLSSLLSGVILWQATRSALLAVASVVVSYSWLAPIATSGELYPSLLILPVQLGLVLLLPDALLAGSRRRLLICGAMIATIGLVKVNIGVFTVAAVGIVVFYVIGSGRIARYAYWALGGVALAVPLGLMLGLVRDHWVLEYLAVCEASIVGLLVSAHLSRLATVASAPISRLILWVALGGATSAAVCLAAVAHAGTPVLTILHYTLIVPLRQTTDLILPLAIGRADAGVTVFAAVCCTALLWRYRTEQDTGSSSSLLLSLIGFAKLFAGPAIIYWGLQSNFSLGAPFGAAFMGLAAFSDQTGSIRMRRLVLVWLLAAFGVFQQLQIYPVAGIQTASGTVWFGLVGLIMVDDGLRVLGRALPAFWRSWVTWLHPSTALRGITTVIVLALVVSQTQSIVSAAPQSSVSLALRGSSWMYLPEPEVHTLEKVTSYLERNCSTFISAPGLDSFYTWSDEKGPLGLLVDDWIYGVTPAEQRAVLRSLQAQTRVCAVVSPSIIAFWRQGRPLPPEPVLTALKHDYVKVRQYGPYDILRRRPHL